ncbi:hypothetical protein MAR_028072 [Mya arenaria]|uniref:Uncharacterized protein n=1 Tax=Mya arenaria TaxID=6604 RepID=A0ABY7DCI9_MYAAR|nr:hypothetical protein MAR_028072 [Mya arenaria]
MAACLLTDGDLQNNSIGMGDTIQHRIGHCTNEANKAKCNCGVGVRAGRDVYIINVCNNYIDIGYKMCFDKALSVKKDNDFTYTIYLPYGTAVRARIDNAPFMGDEGGRVLDLTVMPSLHNRDGNSTESPCKNSSDMCKNHPNTFCQEDRDTYQCVCQRYYEQLDNGTCKETGEPRVNDRFAEIVKNSNDAKEEVDIFRVEIILNYNVPEHDYLEIAGTYETYKTELKDKK